MDDSEGPGSLTRISNTIQLLDQADIAKKEYALRVLTNLAYEGNPVGSISSISREDSRDIVDPS